jgi:predicted nucleotidyltransferase component of viral defense system
MEENIYNQLRLRELFHLEFLRWFGRKVKVEHYALKGGSNIRFFFQSFRYSEDMDLDARIIGVKDLQDIVMGILNAGSFKANLKPFGIEKLIPPDISKAKQTHTTQRFKIHLLTSSGEDLSTKIEFSRRGFNGHATVEPVSDKVLRQYKIMPLLVSHYDAVSAIKQKITALARRNITQARDIFDLYILYSQVDWAVACRKLSKTDKETLKDASQNLFEVGFNQFRDLVISYLAEEDRKVYNSENTWDEIKLRVAHYLEELKK